MKTKNQHNALETFSGNAAGGYIVAGELPGHFYIDRRASFDMIQTLQNPKACEVNVMTYFYSKLECRRLRVSVRTRRLL
jgi:hypothetical protein